MKTTLTAPATSGPPLLRARSPPELLIIMLNAQLVTYIHISPKLQMSSCRITPYKYFLIKFTGMLTVVIRQPPLVYRRFLTSYHGILFLQGTHKVWEDHGELLCRTKAPKCLSTGMNYQLSLGLIRTHTQGGDISPAAYSEHSHSTRTGMS